MDKSYALSLVLRARQWARVLFTYLVQTHILRPVFSDSIMTHSTEVKKKIYISTADVQKWENQHICLVCISGSKTTEDVAISFY